MEKVEPPKLKVGEETLVETEDGFETVVEPVLYMKGDMVVVDGVVYRSNKDGIEFLAGDKDWQEPKTLVVKVEEPKEPKVEEPKVEEVKVPK